jgi:hypothetical protein
MLRHPLSNLELLTWLTGHDAIRPMLGGVYASDNLPHTHHHKPTLYIVNTAKLSHPTGIHWVAMLVGVPTPEYFDSLGHRPCRDFVDFMGTPYIYCSKKLQSPSSNGCGYYCLYYAVCRARYISFERIIHDLNASDDHSVMLTVQQIKPL